jgi:probable phosphoglycerate mutase
MFQRICRRDAYRPHRQDACATEAIRLLLSSLLGFDPRRYRDTLDQNPAALNIVDFKDAVSARLTLFNDTSHYAAAGLAIPAVPTARLSKAWDDERK